MKRWENNAANKPLTRLKGRRDENAMSLLGSNNNQLLSVSVVMSVYDKPCDVGLTIDSVLSQQGVELELIVVSDGASDEVHAVLDLYQDPRLKVSYQANQGLTVALINGCNIAQHDFIARIDTGDEMLEGRLKAQVQALNENDELAMATCWVHTHTEEGFSLYDVQYTTNELTQGLTAVQAGQLKSPVHSSVTFRKSHYFAVGGYRPEFYFTQDCDLWARLLDKYKLLVVPQILQKAVFSASGISGQHKAQQTALAALVTQANALRQRNRSDERDAEHQSILEQAKSYRPSLVKTELSCKEYVSQFSGNYFIASVLSNTQPKAALVYWRKALTEKPWHLVAWLKWVVCFIREKCSVL